MSKLCDYIDSVIDNRGKNPDKYYSIEKYPVIDNYLIKNTIYPNMSDVNRYINQEEYNNFLRCYIRKDEVLMTLVGNGYGNVTLAPSDNVAIIQNTIGFRTNNNLNSIFLFYYLQYISKSIKALDRGSSQPSLKVSDILDLNVNIPDIKKQILISNALQTIDLKIENNNKIISELESMAKTIYDYWFLQFEFPNEDGKPYKSSGGKMVWNDELKREIPEGWEIHNISNLCTLGNGINYDKKVTGDKTYKIVNVRDISASSLLINKQDMNEITLPNELANKYLVNKGDILIARSGTPGAVRLVLDTDNVIYCGFIIHCLPNDLEDRFYLTFTLKLYEGTSATKTGGSILQNVSQDTLKSLTIPLPSKNILSSFNIKIKPLIDRMQLCIEENNQLVSLRDFLLPLLMNGQVTFKEEL